MLSKGSKLYSIFSNKCPRCHEGDVFINGNPYKGMSKMHTNCPHCNLRYEKETGFFFGAMYISYMFNIALFITFVVGYFILLKDYITGLQLMLIYVGLTVLLTPIYHRVSRMIWLNIFQDYKPQNNKVQLEEV